MNETTVRYDVFVSYHWRDHGAVEAVARTLPGCGLRVFLDESKAVAPLAATLGREGSGRGRVNLMIPVGEGREVEIVLPQGYAISAKGRAALRAIPGIVDVQEV